MASFRQKDNGSEMAVRQVLHSMGSRCSPRRRIQLGRPDLVFGHRHNVVFADRASQDRKVGTVSERETADPDPLGQRLDQTLDRGAT